jgi:hypothetical protein
MDELATFRNAYLEPVIAYLHIHPVIVVVKDRLYSKEMMIIGRINLSG